MLVRVSNYSDANLNDASNTNFTIAHPLITIKRPNGGETYRSGEYYPIHWDWTGGTGNVAIYYSTDGGINWTTINSGTTNDGSYLWTVPNVNSTNCRVRIVYANDANAYDISDNNFTITTTQVTDSIMVTSPMSNDNWILGRDYYITWTGTNTSGYVRIDYSTDGGSTWNQITDNAGNNGNYEWYVPNVSSTNCRIRVSNAQNTNANGISGTFEIRSSGKRRR